MPHSRLTPVQTKFREIANQNIKENKSSCSELQVQL